MTIADKVLRCAQWVRGAADGRHRRIVLVAASFLFLVGAYLAWHQLPAGVAVVDWTPLVLVGVLGVPAMILLNALEYQAMAGMVSTQVGLGDSLRVALVGTAANLAPVPGAVLVRWNDLSVRGVNSSQALTTSVVAGTIWLGVSSLAVAAAALGESTWLVVGSIVVATLAWVVSMAMHNRMKFDQGRAALLAIELGVVAISAIRSALILAAFGADMGWQVPVAIAGSYALANVVAIIPGGLGLRELLAGLASRPIAGQAATGFLVSAVDRIIGLVVHASLALILAKRRPRIVEDANKFGT